MEQAPAHAGVLGVTRRPHWPDQHRERHLQPARHGRRRRPAGTSAVPAPAPTCGRRAAEERVGDEELLEHVIRGVVGGASEPGSAGRGLLRAAENVFLAARRSTGRYFLLFDRGGRKKYFLIGCAPLEVRAPQCQNGLRIY